MFFPYEEVIIFIDTEQNFLRACLSINKILFSPWKSFLLAEAIDMHLGLMFKVVQFKTCNCSLSPKIRNTQQLLRYGSRKKVVLYIPAQTQGKNI